MAVAITGITLVLTAALPLGRTSLLESGGRGVRDHHGRARRRTQGVAGHFAVLAGSRAGGTDPYADEADVLRLVKRGQRVLISTNVLGRPSLPRAW